MANNKSFKIKKGVTAKRYMSDAGADGSSSQDFGPVGAFSIDLYTGDGTTSKKITNGIDLSTDGGLVWIKRRSSTSDHRLIDTEGGASSYLASNTQDGYGTGALSSFDTDGFTIGNASAPINAGNGSTYVAWTFKQESSFFDVVSYTGSSPSQTVSHNLNATVGAIFVKRTNTTGNDWAVYHRGLHATSPEDYYIELNTTDAAANTIYTWNSTAPTTSTFSVGNSVLTNNNGDPYTAYVFAHDDSANSKIKCGSYTGNGNANGPDIDLGWEPQWIMVKRSSDVSDWRIFDSTRGWVDGASDALLSANTTAQETNGGFSTPTSTGFEIDSTGSNYNTNGENYIYIAIRAESTEYSEDIDLSTGHNFDFTALGATDITFSNPPASGTSCSFSVTVDNTSHTLTWPTSVKWEGGVTPSVSSSKELYLFITTDGGTTYIGKKAGDSIS